MNQNHSPLFRRTLCAVCAFAFLLTLAGPAAYAAGEAAPAATELTRAQAAAMAVADAAMNELLDSSSYAAMSVDQRQAAAQAQLDQLASQGLVQSGSIRYDEENGMLSFTYDCGVLGGVLLTGWEEEPFVDLPLEMPAGLPGPLDAQNDVRPLGNAIIYYAFDDTVNSSRYPSYLTMQEAWNGWGLSTTLDTDVTVADLRHMDDYDLCILSTHGAYYTYTPGWLFEPERPAPALKPGAHPPMGPLALGDLVGLDVCLAIMDTLYNETHDPKYRASLLMRKMVRAGHLGRKTGKGFFDYTKK